VKKASCAAHRALQSITGLYYSIASVLQHRAELPISFPRVAVQEWNCSQAQPQRCQWRRQAFQLLSPAGDWHLQCSCSQL